jgi:prepilin-type N-terminal cleavage/methylation domain-containing protein
MTIINQMKKLTAQKGFTLIELLVVIGILAILLSIVLIAINPARQFGQANNTKRRSDVTQILNAIGAYAAENKGVLPTGIPTTTPAVIGSGAGEANICADLLTTYIPALPADPQVNNGAEVTSCTTYTTGYTVVRDANNRVTVAAPQAENGETISISR